MSVRRAIGVSVVVGAVAAAALAGCSNGNPTAAPPSVSSSSSEASSPSPSLSPGATQAACSGGRLVVWVAKGSLGTLLPGETQTQFEKQITAAFEANHAGCKVSLQEVGPTALEVSSKITPALASSNPPDVVEVASTDVATYAAAGQLSDLTAARAELGGGSCADSRQACELWLGALNDPAIWKGKLYAAPFSAGGRVLIYNRLLLGKASVDPASLTSQAKLIEAARKVAAANKDVSPFAGLYLAGRDWYVGMSEVVDAGGAIATQDPASGRWTGQLASDASLAGLANFKALFSAANSAAATADPTNPDPDTIMGTGHAAMVVGNVWEIPLMERAGNKGNFAAIPLPSALGDRPAATYGSGSTLVIPARSKNQAAAVDWLRLMLSPRFQAMVVEDGEAAATKSVPAVATVDPTSPQAAMIAALASSWSTPGSPKWAAVAAQRPLETLLAAVLQGQDPKTAAAAADASIEAGLNASR